MAQTSTADLPSSLSPTGKLLILVVAFLGWMCAGMHMSITQLSGKSAVMDLLSRTGELNLLEFQNLNRQELANNDLTKSQPPSDADVQLKNWKALVARWFAWFQCSFLFGAASGGLVLGWLGDRIGRSKGMAASIIIYSAFAGATYFAQSPLQLLSLWFLACLGVGGMWPNGVALVTEAWSGMSRPMVAGVIGTSANIGIFLMATMAAQTRIAPDDWRWVMLVGSVPLILGLFSLMLVPESPHWLATRNRLKTISSNAPVSIGEVFRPPLLRITLIGISLATIPLVGGADPNWMVPWADLAGETASPPDPFLKARVGQCRALTGIVGSLLGGWIANLLGRRRTFFLVSLLSLIFAQYTFWFMYPTDPWFMAWVAAQLGFVSGIYFGWLPLFLPELFPTRVRSLGAGVSFNFGRIITAVSIFATGALMQIFVGDYARIGRVTSLIFVLGIVGIWFAPDTSQKRLEE